MGIFSNTEGDGVVVTVAERSALLKEIETCLAAGHGFSVATLNLDHVVKLRRSKDFLQAYQRQTHITADGNPIVWLSRIAGVTATLVPGSEMVDPLCALCARMDLPVGFYGSDTQTLHQVKHILEGRHPGLRVAFSRAPDMGFDPHGYIAVRDMDDLHRSGARLCFLALGAPKQEILAAQTRDRIPELGFVSVGAGLDFTAGSQQRAPKWVRAIAAEWIWRLAHDPRRLAARYGACLMMLPRLFLEACWARLRRVQKSW